MCTIKKTLLIYNFTQFTLTFINSIIKIHKQRNRSFATLGKGICDVIKRLHCRTCIAYIDIAFFREKIYYCRNSHDDCRHCFPVAMRVCGVNKTPIDKIYRGICVVFYSIFFQHLFGRLFAEEANGWATVKWEIWKRVKFFIHNSLDSEKHKAVC